MLEVVKLVLREQRLDLRQILLRNVGEHQVLVRRQAERALVHLRDLADTRLEIAPGLVLHTAVLDETGEVVPPVLARDPPKVVDVLVERVWTRWLQLVAEQTFDLALEDIKAHTVDGVL